MAREVKRSERGLPVYKIGAIISKDALLPPANCETPIRGSRQCVPVGERTALERNPHGEALAAAA
jgi:hypothetical protein